jgi:hypothetical protein
MNSLVFLNVLNNLQFYYSYEAGKTSETMWTFYNKQYLLSSQVEFYSKDVFPLIFGNIK